MRPKEFVQNYNFHDSLLSGIDYEPDKRVLTVTLDFAFWMQKDFQDGAPETGPCQIVCREVSLVEFPCDINYDQVSILGTECDGEKLTFVMLNDVTDESFSLKVETKDVSFKSLTDSC